MFFYIKEFHLVVRSRKNLCFGSNVKTVALPIIDLIVATTFSFFQKILSALFIIVYFFQLLEINESIQTKKFELKKRVYIFSI